jgi:O-antigen/teichoic acid export membrane protein
MQIEATINRIKNNAQALRGIKNASYLAIGNLLTQIVSFIGFLYIARMLGPNDYGIWVTVGAFVGMFDLLLLGGLNKAVLREASKDISSMHVYLEKTIGVKNLLNLLAIVVCIICSFLTPYNLQTKLYIIICSFGLSYNSFEGFLGIIYQATENMQYISIFSIINRISFVSLSIVFLYYGFGLLALYLIALFSNLSTLIINYKVSKKYTKFVFFSKIQFDINLLKPALIFSLISFIVFLTTRIDLLMISFLGTEKDVGIYGVAYKIASLGFILRNVTATAFFPIFVKHFQNKTMKGRTLIKYSLIFFSVIFVLSLAGSFFVEDIITFLFGSAYKNSGEILRILIFYLAFLWAALPFGTASQATHNENCILIPGLFVAVLNILLNYLLFIKYGLIGIAYSTLVVTLIGSLLISIIVYGKMKKQGYLT